MAIGSSQSLPNGTKPLNNSYNTIPRDHRSTLYEYPFPVKISGAM